jgi:isoleucyl-tRNA synthetase
LEYLKGSSSVLTKRIKPNFKTLGPKYGKLMKAIAAEVNTFAAEDIEHLETKGRKALTIEGNSVELTLEDVEIGTDDIPGWSVLNEGGLTVALDINISPDLEKEGLARELVSKIQSLRKESGYDVMDRIDLRIKRSGNELFNEAMIEHADHISAETLGTATSENILVDELSGDHNNVHEIPVREGLNALVAMPKTRVTEA